LLTAALVPFLVLSFQAQVKLGHYFSVWQSPLILLLALAAGKLAQQGRIRGIIAVLLLALFVYLGVQAIVAVSQVQPGAYAAAAEHLEDTGHDKGPILVWGAAPVVEAYLPDARIIHSSRSPKDAPKEEIEAVIVDADYSTRHPSPEIEEYLSKNGDVLPLAYTSEPVEVYTRKPDG
jgi:hypothetical protein